MVLVLTIEWRQVLELCLYTTAFLSFSLLAGLYAVKKKLLPEKFLLIGSLTFGLTFNYFLFYLYAANIRLGRTVLLGFVLLGLICLALVTKLLLSDKKQLKVVWSYFLIPMLVIATLTTAYSAMFYGCRSKGYVVDQWGEVQNPAFCHVSKLPIDNALPYIYGENILHDRARSLVIDWSIADRPPLQIGTSLPILDLGKNSPPYTHYAYYTVFSIFLQLSWVAAAWGVLSTLLKKRLHIYGLLIAMSATGFLYLNSVFVWPKLLAAGLFVFGAFLLLWSPKRQKTVLSYRYLPMASLAISLSLLSHTGSLFTLLAILPIFAYDFVRYKLYDRPMLKKYGIALLIAACLLVPWQVAKSQLITHDRLVKWHFAGVISAEDQRGTLETIVDEYSKLPPKTWLNNKKANTETLVTGGVIVNCPGGVKNLFSYCNMSAWRDRTFFSSFYSLELFAIGFIIIAWQAIKRTLDKFDKTVLLIYGLYLVIWVLMMFIPGSTVLHQGSYASALLLLLLLGKKIATLPNYAFITFVGLQVSLFALAWLRPFGFL